MATSIGQYTPLFLPGELPSLTEKPGRLQSQVSSVGSQRVGHNQSNLACIDTRHFFACGSSAPVRVEHEGGPAAWLVGTLGRQVCRNTDCLCCRSYGPAAAAAKSFQSCLTMCDPIDSSPPGSSFPEILQARTLEWVAIPFFNA